jgi:hypothetical protein
MFNVTIIRQVTVLRSQIDTYVAMLLFRILGAVVKLERVTSVASMCLVLTKVLCLILTAASKPKFNNDIYICPFQ